jgi:hypothetical protein
MELPPSDDPDVDVVGHDEERNLSEKEVADHETHADHPVLPAQAVPPSVRSKATSAASQARMELPSDDDPDVDVVGYDEESNLPEKEAADHETHADHPILPAQAVATSVQSRVQSAVSNEDPEIGKYLS